MGSQGQSLAPAGGLDRFLLVANDWYTHSFDEQIDFALVFFQNAYHVRDYLIRVRIVVLDHLMSRTEALRIARDLPNGSKHHQVSIPSPWIHRSLNSGGTPRLTLKEEEDLHDPVTVACACREAGNEFFRQHGLDPASMLAARMAMAEAFVRNSDATPNGSATSRS